MAGNSAEGEVVVSPVKAMDIVWREDGSVPKAPRRRTDISVDMQVKNTIRDSLWDLTPLEIDGVVDGNTGLTCRQRLTRDKNRVADGEKLSLGKLYYETLRSIYKTSDTLEQKLKLAKTEVVSAGFRKAFLACLEHPARRGEMRTWLALQSADAVSIIDLKAVCNLLQRQRVASSTDVLNLCMAMVEALSALKAVDKIPDVMELMKPRINEVLVQAYSGTLMTGVSPRKWVQIHEQSVALVMPIEDVKKVMAVDEAEDLLTMSSTIVNLANSGDLGKKIFAGTSRGITCRQIQQITAKSIDKLRGKKVDTLTLNVALKDAVQEIEKEVLGLSLLPKSRQVELCYSGISFNIACRSIGDEVTMRLRCIVREWARDQGLLCKLPGESEFCSGAPGSAPPVKIEQGIVDKSLVSKPNLARKHLTDVCATEEHVDGQRVQVILKNEEGRLSKLDPHWVLDATLLGHLTSPDSGGKLLRQSWVRQCLPVEGTVLLLEEALRRSDCILDSGLCKWASPDVRSELVAAAQLLRNTSLGMASGMGAQSSDFITTVYASLPLFYYHPVTDEIDEDAQAVFTLDDGRKCIRGAYAVKMGFDEACAKESPTHDSIKMFGAYLHLFDDEGKEKFRAVVAKIFQSSNGKRAAAEPAVKSGPPKRAKKAAKIDTATKLNEAADSMLYSM